VTAIPTEDMLIIKEVIAKTVIIILMAIRSLITNTGLISVMNQIIGRISLMITIRL
jgi:hypothetical protein